jgi:hypothetical protein
MHDPLLVRLTDAARLADARGEAERRSLLAGVATESATFVGALVDLGESAAPVSVRTRAGRLHVGSIVLVGLDFAVVEGAGGQLWCPLSAIAGVRVVAGSPPATGARVGTDLGLADALALLVEDHPRVVLELSSGEAVAGVLLAVGVDVLTLRSEGGDVLYVPSVSLGGILRSG